MGIATPPPPPHLIIGLPKPVLSPQTPPPTSTSMSHGFHHHHHHHHHQGGIFGFSSDVFDRSAAPSTTTAAIPGNAGQHEHVAQQSRREKLRLQEFDPAGAAAAGHPQLVPIDDDGGDGDGEGGGQEASMYAAAAGGAGHSAAGSMLSEMFNFAGGGPSGPDLLGYRQLSAMRPAAPPMAAFGTGDWYAGSSNKPQQQQAMHHHPSLTADSAMQLFLMNPPPPPPPPHHHHHQHTRSPSPPPPPPPQPEQHTQTLHHHQALIQAFGDNSAASFGGGQGLSLSLSSSLQQFEMAKAAEELRVRDAAMLYYNQQQQQQLHHLQLEGHGQVLGPPQAAQLGFGPAGVAAVLRSSKYARAAQELLEEFCSIGRGQFRSGRIGRGSAANNPNPNPNPNPKSGGNSGASSSAAAAAASTSSSKEAPPLSPGERFEHQRKKAKLISMLDEVERRYNHYCEQMQMVVNSFDSVMGFGAATPYTALAQKAMSRHFRCLKDAIAAQLRQACELLGEKDAGGGTGLTKGETPRLRILDQTLRQQRAFHHMGMMEQEAWRPQRGLPERSVNVLRAWLFEHFLHPYPSDADKHFLARQTGLSRNQVSNWFINARVRLWKPMVEEMYQQEAKDRDDDDDDDDDDEADAAAAPDAATSSLSPPSSSGVGVGGGPPKSEPHPGPQNAPQAAPQLSTSSAVADMAHAGLYSGRYAAAAAATHALRFGTAGDVSLTLGLRHGAAGGGGSGAGASGDGGGGGGGGGRFGGLREFGG